MNTLPQNLSMRELAGLFALYDDEQIKNIDDWLKIVEQYATENNCAYDYDDAIAIYQAFED